MVTLEQILGYENMLNACKAVIRNKGSAGIDGVKCQDLVKWFYDHPYIVSKSIEDGSFKPSPIKRVYIPKDNGEKRPLGISTTVDRTVQNAIANKLIELYDPKFSDSSFGFRPGRGCHGAVNRVLQYANEGYIYVVDMDLAKFFDTVNHSKLLQVLSNEIKDGRVISLIHRYLRVKIIDGNKAIKNKVGLPQGNNFSPVCANVLLNELDQELEKRGVKFVRYADDCMLFAKSERAARRILESTTRFIEEKLFLKVNLDKTSVGKLGYDTKFLGFGFRNTKDGWTTVLHKKSRKKFVEKMRTILTRRCPKGIEKTRNTYNTFLRGWYQYFKPCISKSTMKTEEQWIRRRIRQILIVAWKRNYTCYKNLLGYTKGKQEERCRMVAFSHLGKWAKAKHSNYILTNKLLHRELGWQSVADLVEGYTVQDQYFV